MNFNVIIYQMKASITLSFILLFLTTVKAQQKNENITVDGLKREFVTYVPAGISKGDKLPVIISLHGRLWTAARQMQFADFRPIADRERVIIVCPQGIDRSWNDGRKTPANIKGINDVKFIDQLIIHIINTYNGDAKRIYVTGMSNGGFMTSRLACELHNRIAAIAVVAASMDKNMSYQPAKPIPALYIQGTEDPLVPFAGGIMKKGAGGHIYGHEEVLKKWAAINNCGNKPVVTNLPVKVDDGTSVIKEEYGGSNNLKVVGFTIVDGGHTWPGGSQYMPKFMVGSVTHNLNA
ncbi:MAG: phospholipase [Mucilaginibacter sp.]|nr:phospholipase [Mucilaginibacter sp.]